MLFATHLLAAAVLGRLSRLSSLWLIVGAAAPDLLDKPLAMVGVVSLYHSVGHSALFLGVTVPVALSGPTGRAAAVGWVSHLFLDALHVFVNARPGDALFLAWPILVPADPLALPPGAFVRHYLDTPSFYLELLLWGSVLAVVLTRRLTSG